MIRYTSKDIINRAEQLADLQNSDFISDSEKQYLLNEAWGIFYQKITNAKDKSFIKKVSVYNGFTLPLDFMQLSTIYETRSKNGLCKMTDGQNSGYDIVNNRIVVSKDYEGVGLTMEYFPHPQTLFYNSGKKEAKSFVESPILILDDDVFVGVDNSLYSYNSDSKIEDLPLSGINGILLKNGYIVREEESNRLYSLEGSLIRLIEGPFVIKGNSVTYDNIKTDEDLSSYLAVVMDESEEILYFIDFEGVIYDRNFNKVIYQDTEISLFNKLFFCRNDGLYFSVNGAKGIIRILGAEAEVFPLNLYSFCAFIDDTYCVESFGGNFYKSTYGFNSLLDYPSNIYFTVLAYSLAVSFKIKQNGDPTLLNSKLEEAVNQFWDSLSRDDNNQYTIRNVYKSRGRIW